MENPKIEKYGALWDSTLHPLQIELACIRKGGKWKSPRGGECGAGLYDHYKNAMTLFWPEDDWHRWADLEIKVIAENTISVIMGCADSGKTYVAGAKWGLVEYWASPSNTLVLISSTDIRGLELRVWGAIKGLFNRAIGRFPALVESGALPGTPLDSLHCIANDKIDEDNRKARVLNRGIICIPCLQSGRYIGMKNYHGIKAPRLRQVSDESAMMGDSHLDALPNYVGKDYKGVFLGNPHDPMDPLGRIAEPENGWASLPEPTKTTTWKIRMTEGTCLNLVGTDSPNMDYPEDEPVRFPYLITRKKIETVKSFWGDDSVHYYSQCVGVMKTGLLNKRVITEQLCRQHHAQDKAVWKNDERTKLYAVDAAYSGIGGDRCMAGPGEFGESDKGTQIIVPSQPKIIQISINSDKTPEDQIADYVFNDMSSMGIPPQNCFYDSTGRGTLGAAFARKFGATIPVPVEFGGKPSMRPVRHDLFIWDEAKREHRHKTCQEHYYDKVSELWLSSRYIIESDQCRELPTSVMREGCQREKGMYGNKEFVESKHDPKARERMRVSPDEYDWFVTLCEGARQRGFKIQKLGVELTEGRRSRNWLDERVRKREELLRSKMLVHT